MADYLCFFPTCGHRTTTLQNILVHLSCAHRLYIRGMDRDLDLCVELLFDSYCGGLLQGIKDEL